MPLACLLSFIAKRPRASSHDDARPHFCREAELIFSKLFQRALQPRSRASVSVNGCRRGHPHERSDPHDPQAHRRARRHGRGRHCCARPERRERHLVRLRLAWLQLSLLQLLPGLRLQALLLPPAALRLSLPLQALRLVELPQSLLTLAFFVVTVCDLTPRASATPVSRESGVGRVCETARQKSSALLRDIFRLLRLLRGPLGRR